MTDAAYRVLARKYRPQRFDDLVGQDVLVRTLTNAFSSGRIAHAFLLTGIRGIGKTTTARIIARGLNCIGPDESGGPTTDPCGVCSNCRMILEERHVDIIEMDAASRTGVDDIREIIDTIHYAPAAARYKIYIIDEVHMLSKNAFNALLKTLEEPPAHVKFIFATTELRKIPVTIISRCQRFDLRRLDTAQLAIHLADVCAKEQVAADPASLQLIATAAEGSVRDALSLLDQAIAMSIQTDGQSMLEPNATRAMLGIADKSTLLGMLTHLFHGNAKEAVLDLRRFYEKGGDPVLALHDLLSLLHYCTKIHVSAELAQDIEYSELEREKASELVQTVSLAALTRGWQMLLKGIDEVKHAPEPLAACEMILIRLAHAANLPTPDALIRSMGNAATPSLAPPSNNAPSAATHAPVMMAPSAAPATSLAPQSSYRGALALAVNQPAIAEPAALQVPSPATIVQPQTFEEIVALFQHHKEAILYSHLYHDVRPVSITQGRIEVLPIRHMPADFAARVGRHLSEWCGQKWMMHFASEADASPAPSLHELAQKAQQKRVDYASSHPMIQSVFAAFDDAEIIDVTSMEAGQSA